jgi:hypothetical protein
MRLGVHIMIAHFEQAWSNKEIPKTLTGNKFDDITWPTNRPPSRNQTGVGLKQDNSGKPLPMTALEKLKHKGRRAMELAAVNRALLGDPVTRLSNLLGPEVLDSDRWQVIVDEPYG